MVCILSVVKGAQLRYQSVLAILMRCLHAFQSEQPFLRIVLQDEIEEERVVRWLCFDLTITGAR